MPRTTYGPAGYLNAHPSGGRIAEWDSTTGYTRWDASGTVVEQRPLTDAEAAIAAAQAAADLVEANGQTVQRRARTALTANATYLALAAPTNAQNAAQIQRLTRECSALIRLALADLATITDT